MHSHLTPFPGAHSRIKTSHNKDLLSFGQNLLNTFECVSSSPHPVFDTFEVTLGVCRTKNNLPHSDNIQKEVFFWQSLH